MKVIFIVGICLIISSCGLFSYETKTVETVRGRLKFVQVLEYRTAGTHGGKGWVAQSQQFYANNKKWWLQPHFDGCEASPSETVEVFKCFVIKDMKTTEFLLRMKDNDAEQKVVSVIDFRNDDSGEWTSIEEGNRLIYKDFFYNVLTDEKIEIKGLPDYPEKHFRAISPDLQTVVYEGSCYYGFSEAPEELKQKREKVCEESKDDAEKNLITLWLIDIKSGESKIIKLSREKYDWLIWNHEKFKKRNDWLRLFQKNLVWEKDKNNKYQLVFPKNDAD